VEVRLRTFYRHFTGWTGGSDTVANNAVLRRWMVRVCDASAGVGAAARTDARRWLAFAVLLLVLAVQF